MDPSGSVQVFRHFLDAASLLGAFIIVPRRHCGGLPRVIAGFRKNLLKKTCDLVIMHMSISFIFFGGGVDLGWEFPHFFPQDLAPDVQMCTGDHGHMCADDHWDI